MPSPATFLRLRLRFLLASSDSGLPGVSGLAPAAGGLPPGTAGFAAAGGGVTGLLLPLFLSKELVSILPKIFKPLNSGVSALIIFPSSVTTGGVTLMACTSGLTGVFSNELTTVFDAGVDFFSFSEEGFCTTLGTSALIFASGMVEAGGLTGGSLGFAGVFTAAGTTTSDFSFSLVLCCKRLERSILPITVGRCN